MGNALENLNYDDPIIRHSAMLSSLNPGGPRHQVLPMPSFQAELTRPYAPNDPIKAVDFRVLARSDEWVVRHVHNPTEKPYVMVVDSTSSMFWPTKPLKNIFHLSDANKYHLALRVLCNVAYHVIKQGRTVKVLLMFHEAFQARALKSLSQDKDKEQEQVQDEQPLLFKEFSLNQISDVTDLYLLIHKAVNMSFEDFLTLLPQCVTIEDSDWSDSKKEAIFSDFALKYRYFEKIFISDLIGVTAHDFAVSLASLKVVHLLSRLEVDPLWLKTSSYFKSDPKMKEGVTGWSLKKHYQLYFQQWLEKLHKKFNFQHSDTHKHYCFLHSHTSIEEYSQNIGEVLS